MRSCAQSASRAKWCSSAPVQRPVCGVPLSGYWRVAVCPYLDIPKAHQHCFATVQIPPFVTRGLLRIALAEQGRTSDRQHMCIRPFCHSFPVCVFPLLCQHWLSGWYAKPNHCGECRDFSVMVLAHQFEARCLPISFDCVPCKRACSVCDPRKIHN